MLRGHAGSVVAAVFSPDAQRIATGGRDGTARLWDAATGRELLALTATEGREGVDSVAFSPDGRRLAVRSDQALRLYVLGIEDLTALVRGRLTRSWTVEECQRFLHMDQCPTGPGVAMTSADRLSPSRLKLRQRRWRRPAQWWPHQDGLHCRPCPASHDCPAR